MQAQLLIIFKCSEFHLFFGKINNITYSSVGNITNVDCGGNHYGQFIGNKLEIFDFRVHFVYLIVGLKIEEVISVHSEQPQCSN